VDRLPFLASLVYSAVVYWRERAMQKKMARLVEAVAAMRTNPEDDGCVKKDKSDKGDVKEPPR
jgi:hypothetical protein